MKRLIILVLLAALFTSSSCTKKEKWYRYDCQCYDAQGMLTLDGQDSSTFGPEYIEDVQNSFQELWSTQVECDSVICKPE